MMEEILEEDWASYIKTAADLNNQLSAAAELLKDTEATVSELELMKESVDHAKDALPELWNRLTLKITPDNQLTLGENDLVEITSEFDDLQIRYTTDGNDPMWFSDEYKAPFAVTKSKQKIKAALFLGRRQMSEVFEAEYLSEEGLNSAEGIEENYIAATDNGTSGDSEGIANALDGKNGTAWYPSTFPTVLEVEFEKPVKVNTAEVALDWFYENYYDITDMDIEYWNGDAWVPAVEGASLGDISKVFTFDEFESNKSKT